MHLSPISFSFLKPQVEVPGGFYLTDSVMVAAQFACYGSAKRPATVEILRAYPKSA
jgi:hypothetical protein